MSDIVIKVENVGKLYRLGETGTGTISHDLNRWWARVRKKPDPFAPVDVTNSPIAKGIDQWVWALKDIDFAVKQGEVMGIIGRNGAGKSTLLKILSKVTKPSAGCIKLRGRIASLLEVGTGFHQELTGRENIFLNGAILGMTRTEVKTKFDEIVDFSGVERFIDTPVKRYSSGMYVRLAFSVAAFLEPEILIIDEVLAVGDGEFQKKCLGRMKEVSVNDGRTVLFVSHNLAAVRSLCSRAVLLEQGKLKLDGSVNSVLEKYQLSSSETSDGSRGELPGASIFFKRWYLNTPGSQFFCYSREVVRIIALCEAREQLQSVEFGIVIRDLNGDIIVSANSRDNGKDYLSMSKGIYEIGFEMPLPLKPGSYEVDLAVANHGQIVDQWVSNTSLKVLHPFNTVLDEKWSGILNLPSDFTHQSIADEK